MNGVFLDAESLADLDFSALEALFDDFQSYPQTGPDDVDNRLSGAEVVIVNKVKLNREILQRHPAIKLICLVATGSDNIDCLAAEERGIAICNCQGYGVESVVQHVFALIFALHTNLLNYYQAVRSGRWQLSTQFCLLDYPITQVQGKTLGIIGYGNLGKGVASAARAFGMKVCIARRPGTKTDDDRLDLDDLLKTADVISLHCPLNEETRNLINRRALDLMKPSGFLINAARGGIVDEFALAEALRKGSISGAGVDVLVKEPPNDDNPLLAGNIPNLIVTPHCAWGSYQARQRIIDQTIENIECYINGKPVRLIGG